MLLAARLSKIEGVINRAYRVKFNPLKKRPFYVKWKLKKNWMKKR